MSLNRLQTDYIDLYNFELGLYAPAYADSIRQMLDSLVEEGKIRAYGWCTDDATRGQLFAPHKHFTAVKYNHHMLEGKAHMLTFCDEHDLGRVIRGPLGLGLLAGNYGGDTTFPMNDMRHHWSFKSGPQAQKLKQLNILRDILTSDGRTLAQAAIGWLWARSERTIPVPGFRTVAQIEENVAALEYGPLSDEQMREVTQILARDTGTN